MQLGLLRQWVVRRLTGSNPPTRPARCRLMVEALEERALLSGGPHHHTVVAVHVTSTTVTTTLLEDTVTGVDAQRGYPLPPSKGPALSGTVGVNPVPAPVLPPMNSSSAANATTGPGPSGGSLSGGVTAGGGTTAPVVKPVLPAVSVTLPSVTTLLVSGMKHPQETPRLHHRSAHGHHKVIHRAGQHLSLPPSV
jgi:hypothetical protein